MTFESTLLEIIHETCILSLENRCSFAFDKLNWSSALTNKWVLTPAGVKEEKVDKNRTFGEARRWQLHPKKQNNQCLKMLHSHNTMRSWYGCNCNRRYRMAIPRQKQVCPPQTGNISFLMPRYTLWMVSSQHSHISLGGCVASFLSGSKLTGLSSVQRHTSAPAEGKWPTLRDW